MTTELPKVVWTSPDGQRRAVLRAVRIGELLRAVVDIEHRSMREPNWVDADGALVPEMAEIIADLSGVKWRE